VLRVARAAPPIAARNRSVARRWARVRPVINCLPNAIKQVSVRNTSFLPWLILPLLAGCGGGGANGSSVDSTVTLPTPAPTPAPTPTPTPSTPTPAPSSGTWAERAAALYDVPSDPASCRPGTLKASVRADVLARLNAIRALHNLPAVTYSDVEEAAEAQSSLMMAVNRQLSHTPPTSWTCYTADGAAAAGSSNLIGGWGNGLPFSTEENHLADWLTEYGSAAIGHRRWLLDPFLGTISYSRVTYQTADGQRWNAASLRVFNFTTAPPPPRSIPAFVAYPYGDYPVRYFRAGDYLSFTAVPNSGGRFGANASVGYAGATISVTGPSGALAVSDVAADNLGYGVANAVQWRVAGLQSGVTYRVTISGITGAAQSSYSYSFRITD
jgi:uncharacterized protein YkwD